MIRMIEEAFDAIIRGSLCKLGNMTHAQHHEGALTDTTPREKNASQQKEG